MKQRYGSWEFVSGDGREPALVHDNGYWVPLLQVRAAAHVSHWARHLGPKNWADKHVIASAVEAMTDWLARAANAGAAVAA